MHYFVIDFETANSSRTSACALGIVEVNNGNIINTLDYLINPEEHFDGFNISLHGISPSKVKGKPTFPQIWNEITNILTNQIIIAHNASFDISVLRHVLDKYQIEYPTFTYSCTRILSKKTWPSLINYKLDTIAKMLDIDFIHHNACEDAIATSKVFEKILSINAIHDFKELHSNLKVRYGQVFPNSYKPCEVKGSSYSIKSYIKPKDIIPECDNFDVNHILYNKGIAFTGTLTSMPRKDATQFAVNKGAFYCNSVNKKTNYLVIGVQDYSKFTDGQKSSKLKKAEDLISQGQDLEIIDENEFLNLI
ncbi:exonuclease domain-containing protein [Clostridium tertium]